MPARRFTAAQVERLAPLAATPGPVGPAARSARLLAVRSGAAERELARLRAALPLPTACLPLLASAGWGTAEVERIADALSGERGGTPWLA
jgi:hypothetical protein